MKRTIRAILSAAALGTLCLLGASQAEAGSPRTMQVDLSGRAMQNAHPAARAAAERKRSKLPALRVEGELRSTSRGLFVGRYRVDFTERTSVFPMVREDRMPDPDSFDGRRVTVFGRQTADGIEATVIVMQGEYRSRSSRPSGTDPYIIPSTDTTGALRSDAPQ